MKRYYWVILSIAFISISCSETTSTSEGDIDLSMIPFEPTTYNLDIPDHFPDMVIPADNPLTVEGVELGRHLFYDPILSRDSSISCSTCHLIQGNFTDNLSRSIGIDGEMTRRGSMTLLNVGFVHSGLFWDGKVMSLEEQAELPIEDPIELHDTWPNVENKLRQHNRYPKMFRQAFGIEGISEISKELATKAIAQFERSLISSGNSKYDRVIAGQDIFTDLELRGHNIFFDIEPDVSKHLECGHCHNAPLFTTNEFINNGLQQVSDLNSFEDRGRGAITGNAFDNGTFRVPTLRNIFISAPYMHNGKLSTIDDVINHYSTGGNIADNIGAVLRPLTISPQDREALLAFLKTLDDPDFINNPNHRSPF